MMDDYALKLRCLELAIEQVRKEAPVDFKQAVADLQTWLYNRIVGELDSPKPASDKPQAPNKRR